MSSEGIPHSQISPHRPLVSLDNADRVAAAGAL
jgi:hypothetical protein